TFYTTHSYNFFLIYSRSFSFTLPRPPTSTLFPYTTLFRSLPGPFLRRGNCRAARGGLRVRPGVRGDAPGGRHLLDVSPARLRPVGARRVLDASPGDAGARPRRHRRRGRSHAPRALRPGVSL